MEGHSLRAFAGGPLLAYWQPSEEPNMQCKEVMRPNIQWASPRENIAAAAKLMALHNLRLLPVCDPDGKPVGVISDRDIALRVIGRDRLAAQTAVEDVMSVPVRSVADDYPVDRVGGIMLEAGVSRLVVLDEGGHLAGLVSVADLLVHLPGKIALDAARAMHARETSDRSSGDSDSTPKPIPEFFTGARDLTQDQPNLGGENAARDEANSVVHGGTNELKEFPS
jgi:CBS domain-containing protein